MTFQANMLTTIVQLLRQSSNVSQDIYLATCWLITENNFELQNLQMLPAKLIKELTTNFSNNCSIQIFNFNNFYDDLYDSHCMIAL